MENKNTQLCDLSENPAAQFWKVPYEQLSSSEKVFVSIWGLEAEVNNGGFSQYFSNSSGDIACHAVSALEQIGAKNFALIAKRAVSIFGESGPSADRGLRQAQLEKVSDDKQALLEELDQEFLKYPDNLTDLLYDFVMNNKSEIRGLN